MAMEAIAGDILIHGHYHQKALYDTKELKVIFSKTMQAIEKILSGYWVWQDHSVTKKNIMIFLKQ